MVFLLPLDISCDQLPKIREEREGEGLCVTDLPVSGQNSDSLAGDFSVSFPGAAVTRRCYPVSVTLSYGSRV